MDKLNLLKLFLSVVDKGSFAAAASMLGLSPSTISKAIARLEDDLRLHLFYRTTRRLTLTESGYVYAETARKILSELESCEQQLGQNNEVPEGRLRINLPVSYGRRYIVPLVEGFSRKYPQIRLDLSFDDAYVDMIEQGIDICIRSGTLEESSLIAKQLSPIDFLICASPNYVQNQQPISVDEYGNHPWIRFRFRQTGRLMPIMVPQGDELSNLDPGREFIVDDGEALAELCAQGVGLTQMPHFIARDWIRKGAIIPIAPYYRPKGFGVWVIYARRDYLPSRIKAFVSYLEQRISASGETAYHTWAELGFPTPVS